MIEIKAGYNYKISNAKYCQLQYMYVTFKLRN